jgi:hypothetical protein
MTTKYITTYVAAGYALSSADSTPSITSTYGVGGTGVYSTHKASIIHDGWIVGSTNDILLEMGRLIQNGGVGDTSAVIEGRIDAPDREYPYEVVTIANYGTIGGSISDWVGTVTNDGTVDGYVSGYAGIPTNGSASDTTALITGRVSYQRYGTMRNFGTIGGGAYCGEGGTIVNGSAADTVATIEGGVRSGKYFRHGSSIVNYGAIDDATTGNEGGFLLNSIDTLTNGATLDASGLIYGVSYGVEARNQGTITNSGSIVGISGDDTLLMNEGTIINGAGNHDAALIEGQNGIYTSTDARIYPSVGARRHLNRNRRRTRPAAVAGIHRDHHPFLARQQHIPRPGGHRLRERQGGDLSGDNQGRRSHGRRRDAHRGSTPRGTNAPHTGSPPATATAA